MGRRIGLAVVMVAVMLPIGGFSGLLAAAASAGPPTDLTVDGVVNPIGVGTDDVQFGWHVASGMQHSYRIRVSLGTDPVWDSGVVGSSDQSGIVYSGPPLRSGTVYRWTVSGSAIGTFETGLRDQDWRARWIRRATTSVPEYTFARTEATLGPSPIVRARAYVAADQQYELSINGTRVGKGQAYGYPDGQYSETLDVTSGLRAGGRNAVGLLYTSTGATKGHPAGTPGAILQISVLHQDGRTERITTDGSWRVLAGNWLPGTQRDLEGDQVDFTENINGLAYPVGWDRPGFAPRGWSVATLLPARHMVAVRTRLTFTPLAARSVTRLLTGAAVYDFGAVVAAVPTVAFHHGLPGRLVTMRAGYLLDPGGQVSTSHGTQHTDMGYSYLQPAGASTFRPFDYLGFRYLQIDDPGEALAVSDVVALLRHTAVAGSATFASSDATVDAVWRLGQHSALFSAQEYFVDTPTREKGPWLWDGFNSSQTTMAAFGEQNLTRKSLLEFAASQARYWPSSGRINKIYPTGLGAQDINEFSEIYAEWVWQYWLNTGDRALLVSVYPTLMRLAEYVQRADVGLVSNLPATNVYYPFPVVTRLNVLGANVFRRTADVASVIGVDGDRWRSLQGSLTSAINQRLRRPNGLYVDGLLGDGTQAGVSQAANIAALAYGIVPANRVATVGAYVAAEGMSVPPRIAGELLAALRVSGRSILGVLTDPHADGWANILAQGATFTWEVWRPSDSNGDSMSHGWGSNVLVEIDRSILGVTPTSGGYATFDVSRPPLAWVRGSLLTPRGTVVVSWHDGVLDLTVPPNAVATVGGRSLGPGHHVVDQSVGN